MQKLLTSALLICTFLFAPIGFAAQTDNRVKNFDFSHLKAIRIVKVINQDQSGSNYFTSSNASEAIYSVFRKELNSKKIILTMDTAAQSIVSNQFEGSLNPFRRAESLDAVLTIRKYGYSPQFVPEYIEEYTESQEVEVKLEGGKTAKATIYVDKARKVDAHWKYVLYIDMQLELFDPNTGDKVILYNNRLNSYSYTYKEPIALCYELAVDFAKNMARIVKRDQDNAVLK